MAAVAGSGKLDRTVGVICGCIDIGTNTTRLLVVDVGEPGFGELVADRVFTRVGDAIAADGSIGDAKIAEVADVVGRQAATARAAGCERIAIVATAAVRAAPNAGRLADVVAEESGLELAILTGEAEARLSFAGATRGLGATGDPVLVADVGGGSTELALGPPGGEVEWWASLAVGSGALTDSCVRSDPPTAGEIGELRARVRAALAEVEPPPATRALAVGGTATSLIRLVGPALDSESLERGLAVLGEMTCAEASERFGLDPVRVRLLPAGIATLHCISDRLGLELRISGGGLREGVVLGLARGEL